MSSVIVIDSGNTIIRAEDTYTPIVMSTKDFQEIITIGSSGPQGPSGLTGPQGPQGPQGETVVDLLTLDAGYF